jgi:hypothetical protein
MSPFWMSPQSQLEMQLVLNFGDVVELGMMLLTCTWFNEVGGFLCQLLLVLLVSDDLSPIWRINGHFNSATYIDMLEMNVMPFLLRVRNDGIFYVAHDRSLIHTSLRSNNMDRGQPIIHAFTLASKRCGFKSNRTLLAFIEEKVNWKTISKFKCTVGCNTR